MYSVFRCGLILSLIHCVCGHLPPAAVQFGIICRYGVRNVVPGPGGSTLFRKSLLCGGPLLPGRFFLYGRLFRHLHGRSILFRRHLWNVRDHNSGCLLPGKREEEQCRRCRHRTGCCSNPPYHGYGPPASSGRGLPFCLCPRSLDSLPEAFRSWLFPAVHFLSYVVKHSFHSCNHLPF